MNNQSLQRKHINRPETSNGINTKNINKIIGFRQKSGRMKGLT